MSLDIGLQSVVFSQKNIANIRRQVNLQILIDIYGEVHGADPSEALDVFDQIIPQKEETNLAYYRKMKRLSKLPFE